MKKPKILALDIETFSLELCGWGLYDQNFGLNQIKQDWTVASWAAKWVGSSKMMYQDVSKQKNRRDDSKILKGIWELINEADILLTQNGVAFDVKKLNARFIINGMGPPSPYKHIDTKKLAKKSFGFTSNSLEYMSKALGTRYKKLAHKKFPGFELWSECLAGNKAAWVEMKRYNIHDVLALEDIYEKMIPWSNPVDFRIYNSSTRPECPTCGGSKLQSRGFEFTKSGKFNRFQCQGCGTWTSDRGQKNNLLSDEKRESLKGGGK